MSTDAKRRVQSSTVGLVVAGDAITNAMLETQLQGLVTDYATLRGWHWCHFRPAQTERGWRTALSGSRGFPDLVMVRRDRVVFIECKRQKARLDRDQEVWFAALSAAGADVHVFRPSDWDKIETLLK